MILLGAVSPATDCKKQVITHTQRQEKSTQLAAIVYDESPRDNKKSGMWKGFCGHGFLLLPKLEVEVLTVLF